jgi:hypothetical protein
MSIACPGSKKKQAIISPHFSPNNLGDPINDRVDIIGFWVHVDSNVLQASIISRKMSSL